MANLRFTLRTLLTAVALVACCILAISSFVEANRRNWEREQTRMFDDNAVRWNDRTYIPNLDIEHTPTIPQWLVHRLPFANPDIFYRVTALDISLGPANPDDFERCTEFQHVDTIRLGHFHDADRLVAAFKLYPRLKTIELLSTDLDHDGRSIVSLVNRELPSVQVVQEYLE